MTSSYRCGINFIYAAHIQQLFYHLHVSQKHEQHAVALIMRPAAQSTNTKMHCAGECPPKILYSKPIHMDHLLKIVPMTDQNNNPKTHI